MPHAKLNQQCVNRPDLDTVLSAGVANLRGFDVVLSIRLEKGQRGEPLDQLATRLGPSKALQQFLEHQAGGEHLICPFKCASKHLYGGG